MLYGACAYAVKNGLWHPQSSISPLVQSFLCAPLGHTWLPLENLSNGLLAECPKFSDLDNRIVLSLARSMDARGEVPEITPKIRDDSGSFRTNSDMARPQPLHERTIRKESSSVGDRRPRLAQILELF